MSYLKMFIILFFFVFFDTFASSSSNECPKQQSDALLLFKHSLSSFNSSKDNCETSRPKMMSWNTSTDCCNDWVGVYCDYSTGDVIDLDLFCGRLQGTLHPNTSLFNHLPHLTYLDLSNNRLSGTLPSWLFTSLSLESLILEDNMFNGIVPFHSFALPSLKGLDLGYNELDGDIPSDISINLTHLTSLDLSYNQLNGTLPSWLFTSPSLLHLYLDNNMFTGNVPFHSFALPSLIHLDLSRNNELSGQIDMQTFPQLTNLTWLDLSFNNFSGELELDTLLSTLTNLQYLYLQSNLIEGQFPPSICNMSDLYYLDMSNNRFGGLIPQCFGNITSSLWMIDMGNNNFQGTIPSLYANCENLEGLILKGNQLEGEVPSSWSKCQSLKVVDFGNNHLNGTFPGWLGDLPNLQALVLKSNNFHGHIQPSATVDSPFPSLRVLDLSYNRFVGQLPANFFQNFSSMKNVVKRSTAPEYLSFIGGKYYSFVVAVKGVNQDFPKVLVDYTIIDLSSNSFEGQIPNVIGGLNSLIVLNLSHNSLIGPIPRALGNLSEIESLDLSWNQLIGEIPGSLAGIKRLAVLSLSHNRLVGRIPSGTQFNTFNENSFEGNVGLCGFPLPKRCGVYTQKPKFEAGKDQDEESGFTWEVVTLGYGCGTLLGLVMGYLMLLTRKVKWFNAIADAGKDMILERNKRRYIFIGK